MFIHFSASSLLCLQLLPCGCYRIHSFVHLLCADSLHIYILDPDIVSNTHLIYVCVYTQTHTDTHTHTLTISSCRSNRHIMLGSKQNSQFLSLPTTAFSFPHVSHFSQRHHWSPACSGSQLQSHCWCSFWSHPTSRLSRNPSGSYPQIHPEYDHHLLYTSLPAFPK